METAGFVVAVLVVIVVVVWDAAGCVCMCAPPAFNEPRLIQKKEKTWRRGPVHAPVGSQPIPIMSCAGSEPSPR